MMPIKKLLRYDWMLLVGHADRRLIRPIRPKPRRQAVPGIGIGVALREIMSKFVCRSSGLELHAFILIPRRCPR